MSNVKRLILDVLKPHQPNVLDFSRTIAALGNNYKVTTIVEEMDDKTESLMLEISGDHLNYEAIVETISVMGGSVHSIDQVEVHGEELVEE